MATHANLPNIHQVQQLCASRHFRQGVHFEGVVTLVEQSLNYIVVQDSSGGIRVGTSLYPDVSLVGHRIRIDGSTAAGATQESIIDASVADLGPASPLAPRRLSAADLSSDRFDNLLVTLNGVLSSEGMDSSGVLVMSLNVSGKSVGIRVLDDHNRPADESPDADLAVIGVAASSADVDGNVKAFTLLTSSTSLITVIRKAPDIHGLPLKTTAWVRNLQGMPPPHRIRLHGFIRGTADASDLQLVDETGSIPLRYAIGGNVSNRNPVTLVAFASAKNGRQTLEEVTVLDTEFPLDQPTSISNVPTRLMTTAAQIRGLSAEQARLRMPVELDGVLTYFDESTSTMFIQDRTAGVFVSIHGYTLAVKAGDHVHISGVTGAGDFRASHSGAPCSNAW